ncbi:MAG: gliding motility-associated ABC transporter substrate-binding protein GldG [Bacteroidales bacterium]|nr:gliding motility-associated ABC transporter substrate-binding protein GldG [Bacteroidales bacterium]
MDSKIKIKRKKAGQLILALAIIILINVISSQIFTRIDLTAEKKYTLTDYTKESLKNLDGQVFITIYLDGNDLPLQFKKFRNSVKEILDVFKMYSGQNFNYEFVDPTNEENNVKERDLLFQELYYLGVVPVENNEVNEGQATQTLIFPSAVINYTYYDTDADSLISRRVGLNLLNNDPNYEQSSPENINNSVQNLEYSFINEIIKISKKEKPKIAFIEGHGELSEIYVIEMEQKLSEYYNIMRGKIDGQYGRLDNFEAIIIAKPTAQFSKEDKFVIDQYVMNGGKVLWLVDGINISMDSVYYYERAFAMPAYTQVLSIDDILFTYGVRINTDILQDAFSSSIMLKGTSATGEVRNHWYQWFYFPLLITKNTHVINRYIDAVRTEFVSSIDTVGKNPEVTKTPLLTTSNMTRVMKVNMPWQVDFKEINETPDQKLFNAKDIPVAILLEGEFPSLFKGRMIDNLLPQKSLFKEKSVPTKMIVVADGDIIKNVVKSDNQTMPLSFDKYSLYNYYGNEQFLMNALNYLCDDEGLMSLRSREFKLRLLDNAVVSTKKSMWQFINLLLPIVLIIILGLVMHFIRIRKYTRK